jgi:RNA polymerase sigma-70 factor (ECF subfamily)
MDELQGMIAREIPHLHRYALALLRNADAADDLVQDCLERALRKRLLWRRQGSMRSWLFRMLYNVFLNSRNVRRREKLVVPLEAIELTMTECPRQETYVEYRAMAQALDQLPRQQYAAIMLIALEGFAYDEAAWILGVPIGTLAPDLRVGERRCELCRLAAPRRASEARVATQWWESRAASMESASIF